MSRDSWVADVESGRVGQVENVSSDRAVVDVRWNDDSTVTSVPVENVEEV